MTVIAFPVGGCTGLAMRLARCDWEGLTHAIQGGVNPCIQIGNRPLWQQILRRVPMDPLGEQDLSRNERDLHASIQRLLRAVVAGLDTEQRQLAMMEALRAGRSDFGGWLIEAGANPRILRLGRAVMSTGDDVQLGLFGYDARVATLNLFIANGTNPDAASEDESTPLVRAIVERKTRWVNALLTAGADPNLACMVDGVRQLPLETAILSNQPDCVAALLMAGAATRKHPMTKEWEHLSLGEVAAMKTSPHTLNLILGSHGRGDITKWLRAALTGGNFDNVLWCLDAGADPYTPDHKGRTGADFAAMGGEPRLIRHMMHQGVSMTDTAWAILEQQHPDAYQQMLPVIQGRNIIQLEQWRGKTVA